MLDLSFKGKIEGNCFYVILLSGWKTGYLTKEPTNNLRCSFNETITKNLNIRAFYYLFNTSCFSTCFCLVYQPISPSVCLLSVCLNLLVCLAFIKNHVLKMNNRMNALCRETELILFWDFPWILRSFETVNATFLKARLTDN